ncbi:ABC transporter ATP-binding protein [Clostridium omnivorum]|uniref:ABC transporter ATP-binding protein n=1 Tax=Clostridium omnivorum TaxID=1604902 RepID=A0ABQ5N7T3_9CLOT|nr:ATP-binding cassette domain-containing protein [Clostridium sp. E14]GLC31303.1 ABC transporter ATP-binding protein [Clostridium sp. E14]
MLFEIINLKYKDILNIEKLEIPENKITCIVGESGSGKTTLLRHLNGLVSADSGNIYFKGKNIDELDNIQLRRKVVMLSQNPAIFPGNIRDNLIIGLKFSDKSEVADDNLNRTLELVHLDKNLEDDAEKLSGGEKQRVALGRILLMEPEVLLLDEPSSALDEATEKLVIERVVEYSKVKKKSLIMVTHSKNIAKTYGEYIVEVKKGGSLSNMGVMYNE